MFLTLRSMEWKDSCNWPQSMRERECWWMEPAITGIDKVGHVRCGEDGHGCAVNGKICSLVAGDAEGFDQYKDDKTGQATR